MLEKGFSNPTDRVVRLRNMILTAKPYVESERAVLATEAYKESGCSVSGKTYRRVY